MWFKSRAGVADEDNMGRQSASTIDASSPRNVRIARKPVTTEGRLAAIVIECVDKTCTVVGNGFALSCHSIQQAMHEVEEIAPRVAWHEKTPGFWVARNAEPSPGAPAGSTVTMPAREDPSWRARPRRYSTAW